MCSIPVVHVSLLIFRKLPFPFLFLPYGGWGLSSPTSSAFPSAFASASSCGKPTRRCRVQTPSAHRHEVEVCKSLSLIIGPCSTPTDLPTQRGVTAPVWYCLIIVADTKEAGGARDIRHSPSVRGPWGFWQRGQVIKTGQKGFIALQLRTIVLDWLTWELNNSAVKLLWMRGSCNQNPSI